MTDHEADAADSWQRMQDELAKVVARTSRAAANRTDAVAQQAEASGDTKRAAYARALSLWHGRRHQAAVSRCCEAAARRAATAVPRPTVPRPRPAAQRPRSRRVDHREARGPDPRLMTLSPVKSPVSNSR